MTVIYVSDFDLRGSGYMNIGVSLCGQLATRGYDVIALGLGYNGQEHHNSFKIVPAQISQIVPMIKTLRQAINIEAIIVALDIPLQAGLLKQLNAPSDIPYIGLFPLESGPLCTTWAMNLLRMNERLVMSRFAQVELKEAGVESTFMPIGLDMGSWRSAKPEEKLMLRQGLGVENDTFVVLTVADNQERKNLSRSLEIFADFIYGFQVTPRKWIEDGIVHLSPTQKMLDNRKKAVYWLVTRPELSEMGAGWGLEDYANQLGILDKVMIWQRGMPFKNLWALYVAADALLLTSKAEGLAMPVLEAMSCRLPVIGTRCAAIKEHLEEMRGFLIDIDYTVIDPWGNSERYFASQEDGAYKLALLANGMSIQDEQQMLDNAQEYIRERTWTDAGQVLVEAIDKVTKEERAYINMADMVVT